MYFLFSSSQRYAPLDFFVKKGYGSKYLTGLFTPDGMTFLELENKLEFFNNIFKN
jgi:hypothetical protein